MKTFFSFTICYLILFFSGINAQSTFTKADTLRGTLNENRNWFDVKEYDINLNFDIENKNIEGFVSINYQKNREHNFMQLDLYENMLVDSIIQNHKKLEYSREGDIILINIEPNQNEIKVYYHGSPVIAERAPWDGGFVWSADKQNKPWVGLACEGDGASLWFPNKDHLSDEPEKVIFTATIPDDLYFVSNGRLIHEEKLEDGKRKMTWQTNNTINSYNISVNIADYFHFKDSMNMNNGEQLDMDYYVLQENKFKAKKHFGQTKGVLEAFEHYFGPYPFANDGFKLVETPYLGMEHQSCIAYGNKYTRGYLGGMIPEYMDWDYIIVHETGHEYFGNSISCNDLADMWIHESFTTYMEALYVEYHYEWKDVLIYLESQRPFIKNTQPIVGPRDVNFQHKGTSDHYYKGAWMLHTLRNSLGDDKKWFEVLKKLHTDHKKSHMDTKDVVDFFSDNLNKDTRPFFNQYLRNTTVPILEVKTKKKKSGTQIKYRWKNCIDGFDMPVFLWLNDEKIWIEPSTKKWNKEKLPPNGLISLPESYFYIDFELN